VLKELRIKNLAIIKELELELEDGFIALTGETGAGKSIILDGINLLIGEKVSADMLRKEAEILVAEGVFEVKENTLDKIKELGIEVEDNEIIIKRIIERNSKGKVFCNDNRISMKALKSIMEDVVDLVGQHSHQMLLNKASHIQLLDSFLDEESKELKKHIKKVYDRYLKVNSSLFQIEKQRKELEEKKDFYEFQYSEITEAKLKENEDNELEKEYRILFNSGKIRDNLIKIAGNLREREPNILSLISGTQACLEKLFSFGSEYESMNEKLSNIYYELEEIFFEAENKLDEVETDENRISYIADRLDKIKKLKLKYGTEISEILEYRDELKQKLDNLNTSSSEELKLKKEKIELEEEYSKKSTILSKKRRKIAEEIEYKLVRVLESLNMKGIKFKISILETGSMNLNGKDEVEFLISTNIGEGLKPLAKIVSGGEISRIMLALKSIFSLVDDVSLLIFDEIDTGIGGETVKRVAEKLYDLSKNTQVVCITHSPHIASKANQQFYIEKKIEENTTVTCVKKLSDDERIHEIARMLSGEDSSKIVKQHAMELLRREE
jgi:DNA repair protein RecN (Recombination protein N)